MSFIKRKSLAFILFILVIMVVSGCSEKEAVVKAEPEVINHDFLLFKAEETDDEGSSIGSLFIKSNERDAEKISTDVMDGHYTYINDHKKVLFVNSDQELYEYTLGKEKSKVAEDVITFRGDYEEEIVTYITSDDDLYLIQGESDREKIASNVYQYDIMGDYLYYIDEDADFSLYNLKDKQEKQLDSDVSSFTNLNGKDEVAYLDEDGALFFYQLGAEDSIKITGNEVAYSPIKKIGDELVYLSIEDGDSDLYVSEIKQGGETEKIASDVMNFKYEKGYFYYVNNDGNLYKKKAGDESSTKLASNVLNFKMKKGTIFYITEDSDLYKLNGEKAPEKLNSSVISYETSSDGKVVYDTEDHQLYIDQKKLTSDFNGYSFFYGNLAFVTKDDKLFLMKDLKEKQLIMDDLDSYSNAEYQNERLYMNQLEFEDIAGIWVIDQSEGGYFIKIDKNGVLENVFTGEKEKLEVTNADYTSIYAGVDEEYFTFTLKGKDQISLTNDEDIMYFTKSSQKEADEFYKRVQEEEDHQSIYTLIDDYLSGFVEAIYYGEPEYAVDYIAPNSPLYKEQENFINSTYEKDIIENLLEHNINKITSAGPDTYTVQVSETFDIYRNYDDHETMNFKNTYTVKKFNGKFLITDLKVKQDSSDSL
ncbi:TcaA NTF2-like domain-containing protein [Mesobacillus thioparans]|uniref:TcaA NTF2-like domain-containing protein n=1 Tax=Mesobacillus thioparans TaxID=370439 RepID=UPI0039F12960